MMVYAVYEIGNCPVAVCSTKGKAFEWIGRYHEIYEGSLEIVELLLDEGLEEEE